MCKKLTRRAALGLVAGGGSLLFFDTRGATQIEAGRTTDVATTEDKSAILGLEGFDDATVHEEPHEVTVTNQTGVALDSGTNEGAAQPAT
jgi:hypothetical protein